MSINSHQVNHELRQLLSLAQASELGISQETENILVGLINSLFLSFEK